MSSTGGAGTPCAMGTPCNWGYEINFGVSHSYVQIVRWNGALPVTLLREIRALVLTTTAMERIPISGGPVFPRPMFCARGLRFSIPPGRGVSIGAWHGRKHRPLWSYLQP
jgi:hypothetical protein